MINYVLEYRFTMNFVYMMEEKNYK